MEGEGEGGISMNCEHRIRLDSFRYKVHHKRQVPLANQPSARSISCPLHIIPALRNNKYTHLASLVYSHAHVVYSSTYSSINCG